MNDTPSQVMFYGNEAELSQDSTKGPLKCKFLLVSGGGARFFLFGPVSEFPYHANLLDRFCSDRGIAADWAQRPDLLEVYDEHTQVLGGGYLELDPVRRDAVMSGFSKAYGEFERSVVETIVKGYELFEGYSIEIE